MFRGSEWGKKVCQDLLVSQPPSPYVRKGIYKRFQMLAPSLVHNRTQQTEAWGVNFTSSSKLTRLFSIFLCILSPHRGYSLSFIVGLCIITDVNLALLTHNSPALGLLHGSIALLKVRATRYWASIASATPFTHLLISFHLERAQMQGKGLQR